MSDQLDVFLGQNTAPFLSNLFEAIESEEYMINAGEPEIQSTEISDNSCITQQLDINPALLITERECTPPITIEVIKYNLKKKKLFYKRIMFRQNQKNIRIFLLNMHHQLCHLLFHQLVKVKN